MPAPAVENAQIAVELAAPAVGDVDIDQVAGIDRQGIQGYIRRIGDLAGGFCAQLAGTERQGRGRGQGRVGGGTEVYLRKGQGIVAGGVGVQPGKPPGWDRTRC